MCVCVCVCVEREVNMHLQGKNQNNKPNETSKTPTNTPKTLKKEVPVRTLHFKLVSDILILTADDVHGAFQHMTNFREVAGY